MPIKLFVKVLPFSAFHWKYCQRMTKTRPTCSSFYVINYLKVEIVTLKGYFFKVSSLLSMYVEWMLNELTFSGFWRIQIGSWYTLPHSEYDWSFSLTQLYWKTKTPTSWCHMHASCLVSNLYTVVLMELNVLFFVQLGITRRYSWINIILN